MVQEVEKTKAKVNLKLISTTTGVRVSQACDRCRIKKIKCDGLTPCHNCSKIGFDCKTSDKLTRRAFPKGYTENLENQVKMLEEENKRLRLKAGEPLDQGGNIESNISQFSSPQKADSSNVGPTSASSANGDTNGLIHNSRPTLINNPIDQIFNLDKKGIIIGNDNLNFESQFNHLLINLNLPFLKITNSHNYLLNDPNSYLYHPSSSSNQRNNRDLDVIYNPLTSNNDSHDDYLHEVSSLTNNQLPMDIYELFIKLINNFKKIFNSKKELDNQITQFFLNYNVLIPIFDYKYFIQTYDNFHTMYPFIFTYDDATINGFNILNNDYNIVNEYLMVVIQIYAMIMINDPTNNLNSLLNHTNPCYANSAPKNDRKNIIRSLYDFLPYFNVFHVSINQLQTYLLFLYYSLLSNNKEKSLILLSLINSFIGILGINLNSKNLFFNDLSLNISQRRDRVKIFWVFKVLLKCFNLKFGFKPSINTTVINPVTIDRYFQLTPDKLSALLESDEEEDELFKTLLKPSVEFLNLVNVIIPSSFSPNYYQYLKHGNSNHKRHPKNLDWILNDDDGDGNDGNLNYNFTQFVTIDNNLSSWRESLKTKNVQLLPLELKMGLAKLPNMEPNCLYHTVELNNINDLGKYDLSSDSINHYLANGVPDADTAFKLIKIQLNFHYLLLRSINYLNFIVDRDLNHNYYEKILKISQELLSYFIIIFGHVSKSQEIEDPSISNLNSIIHHNPHSTGTNPVILDSLGLDVDEDGFVINDFLVKRRKPNHMMNNITNKVKQIPSSPFNAMLNGLSITNINLKKSIMLQMLYSLIYLLKSLKKNRPFDYCICDTISVSINIFIKIFINYEVNSKKKLSGNKLKEDELFKKLFNDELKEEILKEQKNEEEENENEPSSIDPMYQSFLRKDYINGFHQIADIDWDDEEMDEDIKYLKILKFIKYKVNFIKQVTKRKKLIDSDEKSIKLPPPSISQFITKVPKIPSLSKLDYLLPEENFPTHTMAGNLNNKEDLIRREKLAINDLMSLKNTHGNPYNN